MYLFSSSYSAWPEENHGLYLNKHSVKVGIRPDDHFKKLPDFVAYSPVITFYTFVVFGVASKLSCCKYCMGTEFALVFTSRQVHGPYKLIRGGWMQDGI